MQKITPCLWFDQNAEDAARFYTSIFQNSNIGQISRYGKVGKEIHGMSEGTVMTVEFEIEGYSFTGLNGGPIFTFTPAISFFVQSTDMEEIDMLWEKLSEGGKALMEIGETFYSKKYGWLADKYGVTWQLMVVEKEPKQKILPSLMFANDKFGKAEEAMNFYISVFPDSKKLFAQKAGAMEPYNNPDAIMHATFSLRGQEFAIMDGPGKHDFEFNEAISFQVFCKTQEEIDEYWKKLSAVPASEQCGWLKDKYGVSWQIVPEGMEEMMKDPKKAERVMAAFLPMKKLDLKKLEEVAAG